MLSNSSDLLSDCGIIKRVVSDAPDSQLAALLARWEQELNVLEGAHRQLLAADGAYRAAEVECRQARGGLASATSERDVNERLSRKYAIRNLAKEEARRARVITAGDRLAEAESELALRAGELALALQRITPLKNSLRSLEFEIAIKCKPISTAIPKPEYEPRLGLQKKLKARSAVVIPKLETLMADPRFDAFRSEEEERRAKYFRPWV